MLSTKSYLGDKCFAPKQSIKFLLQLVVLAQVKIMTKIFLNLQRVILLKF